MVVGDCCTPTAETRVAEEFGGMESFSVIIWQSPMVYRCSSGLLVRHTLNHRGSAANSFGSHLTYASHAIDTGAVFQTFHVPEATPGCVSRFTIYAGGLQQRGWGAGHGSPPGTCYYFATVFLHPVSRHGRRNTHMNVRPLTWDTTTLASITYRSYTIQCCAAATVRYPSPDL